MNEKISLEYNGKLYEAEYLVIGDTLTVYLPDGSMGSTELRSLNPESAAKTHLRSYAIQNT
jgi:hypothetical protein